MNTEHDILIADEVADILRVTGEAVRRMTRTRAQQSHRHPIPFFKVNGALRFERQAILTWLSVLSDADRKARSAKGCGSER